MARTPDARGTSTLWHRATTPRSRSIRAPRRSCARPSGTSTRRIRRPGRNALLIGVFVFLPMVALIAAIPFAWGWGLNWHDILVGAVFYWVSGLGITVGYHRYFTHGSFKAKHRPSGRDGDRGQPGDARARSSAGSPTTGGTTSTATRRATRTRLGATARRESPDQGPALGAHPAGCSTRTRPRSEKFAPDLLADKKIRAVPDSFPAIVVFTLLAPAADRWLLDSTGAVWSWHGAIDVFFWASLVRVTLLHHVTWSINSICHTWGDTDWSVPRPVGERLLAGHRCPSASPGTTCTTPTRPAPGTARCKGQIDQSARVIQWFEKLGWAYDVRWPDEARLTPSARLTRRVAWQR